MKKILSVLVFVPCLTWAQAELPKIIEDSTKSEAPEVKGAVVMGGPCHEDIQKYCSGEKGNPEAKKKCIKENKDKFSEVCRGHLKEMKDEWKQAHEACEGDLAKYCAHVPQGKGGRLQCLKKNEGSLSDACKSSMGEMKAKKKAWKKEKIKHHKKESNN